MSLSSIQIKNFRNLNVSHLDFSPHLNLFYGGNGAGKSAIIEALYFISHAKSFRVSEQNRLVHIDQNFFLIKGTMGFQLIKPFTLFKDKSSALEIIINDKKNFKKSELVSLLPLQLMTTESFQLVFGGSAKKRSFIDWGLFYQDKDFYSLWLDIKKIIKNRNFLLRKNTPYEQIKIWDQQLITFTNKLSLLRGEYFNELSVYFKKYITLFLPGCDLKLKFFRGWNDSLCYSEVLEKNIDKDYNLGFTNLGAHKASFSVLYQNVPIEKILSRGQIKLVVCALIVAQGDMLKKKANKSSMFLIDDFSSELDTEKTSLLFKLLSKMESQVFVTAINKSDFFENFSENLKMFHVEHGIIKEI